jgi:hypothetical protein
MHRTRKNVLLQYLHKLVPEPDTLALSDRELLQRFREQRDEAAFTMLVRRHGPMVLRLCQRLVQNYQDAEDVCQATFLVLAAKASSRNWQSSVASWLYRLGVGQSGRYSGGLAGLRSCAHRTLGCRPRRHVDGPSEGWGYGAPSHRSPRRGQRLGSSAAGPDEVGE